MTLGKFCWVLGGVIAASMLDLGYMFWSRSNAGSSFNKAAWNAGTLGKGSYNIMKLGKVFHK